MRSFSIYAMSSLMCAALLCGSCSNAPKQPDSVKMAEDQNEKDIKGNEPKEEAAEFLVKATDGNRIEIELGTLAAKQGRMQEVKDFGNMMKEHHGKVLEEIKAMAGSKNITIPSTLSDDSHKKVKELSKKSGKEFDEKYIALMVEDHKADVKAFEEVAADEDVDMETRKWAQETLPVLRSHLTLIKQIEEKSKMNR